MNLASNSSSSASATLVQPATLKDIPRARTERSALDRLDAVLRKHFHNPDVQAIRVVMATIKSHYMNLGDPAWLFVIAPPGSGKTTTTVMGAAGLPQVQILGSWSASTFLSGFHGAKQPGLLEKLGDTTEHDKTFITNGDGIFICKDFTTVISMQRDRRAEILSQLREIHDGEFRKDFGTGVTKIWRGRVTMIAAVTPALDHAHGMSAALGERFLKIRWDRPELEAGEAAIDQQTSERNIAPALIKAVGDVFLDASTTVPEISNAVRRQIATIANLVAFARTHVYRNAFGNREILDVSVPEANTRIAKGLAAIARGDAALQRKDHVDDAVLLDIYRVALDCIPPTRRDVFTAVLKARPVPVGTTPARALEDLQELGLVELDRPALTALARGMVDGSRMLEVLNMD